MAVQACEEAMKKLKEMADKCNTTKQTKSSQIMLQNARKRLLWPFKKDTVANLQATLGMFQDNLTPALQCAGLDAVLRELVYLHPRLDIIHSQSASIERHVIHHTNTLRLLRDAATECSLVQHQNHAVISQALNDLRTELSGHSTALRSKIDLLIGNDSTLRDPTTIPPSFLAETTELVGNIEPQFQMSLQKYNVYAQQMPTPTTISHSYTTCRCRSKSKRSYSHVGWVRTFSEETYSHRPDCHRFAHADYSRSVAAQFTVYSRFFGLCVQASWQSSRREGWNTISPLLQYRAVVSSDSPALKLFENANSEIDRLQHSDRTDAKLKDLLSNTSSALQRCCGKNASPTDVDEYGNGLAFV
ncbi:hypothetical protein CC86DRAFT_415426, partial [Ophiobolus disseminans]